MSIPPTPNSTPTASSISPGGYVVERPTFGNQFEPSVLDLIVELLAPAFNQWYCSSSDVHWSRICGQVAGNELGRSHGFHINWCCWGLRPGSRYPSGSHSSGHCEEAWLSSGHRSHWCTGRWHDDEWDCQVCVVLAPSNTLYRPSPFTILTFGPSVPQDGSPHHWRVQWARRRLLQLEGINHQHQYVCFGDSIISCDIFCNFVTFGWLHTLILRVLLLKGH